MNRVLVLFVAVLLSAQAGVFAKLMVKMDELDFVDAFSVGISGDGSVVIGITRSYTDYGPIIWSWDDGLVTGMGRGELHDLSDDGSIVVGQIRQAAPEWYPESTYGEAAYWLNGELTPMGHLPGADYLDSTALLVSGDGSVILGTSATAIGKRFFRYKNNSMTGLGIFGDLQAISHDGNKFIYSSESGLWLWENGSISEITPLEGYTKTPFAKFDLSDDGSVIAGSGFDDDGGIPIRWDNGHPSALPIPRGLPNNSICLADSVSGDGKVILGYAYLPLIGWQDYVIWREVDGWIPRRFSELDFSGNANWPLFVLGKMTNDGTTASGVQYVPYAQPVLINFIEMLGQHHMNNGIAETGDWLGRVHAAHDPWIWCEKVPCWFNIPEETADAEHGWVYPPDQDSLLIVDVHNFGYGFKWGYSFALQKWMFLTGNGWAYMM